MNPEDRTWMCTVLFMDIVEYSQLSVDQQMMVKQNFSTVVVEALRALDSKDCINLDTGDGAAICYLGAPEEVLQAATYLHDMFIHVKAICTTCYGVRMGINLGPVRILDDINGQRNAIGDGINTAQRVMSFAHPNQLLVSRAYYDVVSCLSVDNAKKFTYLGIMNDKHVRGHAVYAVNLPGTDDDDPASTSGKPVAARCDTALSDGSVLDLDERIVKAVQKQLALFMGPMARILIKKALLKSHDIDELYNILAEDIPTEPEKASFLESKRQLH